jgi:hypothetical protein
MVLENKVLEIFQFQKMLDISKSLVKSKSKLVLGEVHFYHGIPFFEEISGKD